MSAAPPIVPKSMSTALNRVDGRVKVTGAAKYPAEFNPPNAAYAFLVMSSIAKANLADYHVPVHADTRFYGAALKGNNVP